ncbi:MAG TPA: DUF4280 domain-containing protein [Verrucomicrobiae bacterium]|nr:DUF4280 domain-containing protein [Verrucomicrobiae bacterium]
MGQLVVNGAMMACTFGAAPATLIATSAPTATAGGQPAATIMDFAPMTNIPTFGMCSSIANPQVAAATAAALGVLTPQPCIPNTVAPWTPGSPTVTIGGNPALTSDCMCSCLWAGEISITNPGQTTTTVAG